MSQACAAPRLCSSPRRQVAIGSGSTQPLSVNLFGVQRNGLGDPQVVSGHPLAGPDQVVVDSKVGSVGSVLTIGGHHFDVVGTVDNRTMTGGVPAGVHDAARRATSGDGGKAPDHRDRHVRDPSCRACGLVVLSPPTVVTATVSQLKTAVASIDNTRWLMWFVAAAIVASMLYVAALERKRDFAVLKALGSSSQRSS